MTSARRPHSASHFVERYRAAARAGAWDIAKLTAILLRRQLDKYEDLAECLYAEGYAREQLGDVRLAAACYEMAVRLNGNRKARARMQRLPGRQEDDISG